MTDTAGIHFGSAWLRNTFVEPNKPQHGSDHNIDRGGGNMKSGNSNTNVMAPAKLAEFRYGREEMLALFELPVNSSLPFEQTKVIQRAGLWPSSEELGNNRGRPPMNLMGPMSEEVKF